MIKNLWKMTHFYCSHRHEIPIEMSYNEGPHSLFYSCPKYYPDKREPGERACSNRLNFVDAENILNILSNMIEEDERNDKFCDYTNKEFDYKTIHIKVLRYETGRVDLEILNRKALK